jgi:hypothetical protein
MKKAMKDRMILIDIGQVFRYKQGENRMIDSNKKIKSTILAMMAAQIFLASGALADSYSHTLKLNPPDANWLVYQHINKTLTGYSDYTSYEVSDNTSHDFQHIQTKWSDEMNRRVFRFYSHINKDDDRGLDNGKVRAEIKVYDKSHDWLKARLGEKFKYNWKFKIPSDYQAGTRFGHIFQLKSKGGDDGAPIFTLSTRVLGNSEKMYVQYQKCSDSSDCPIQKNALKELSDFKGKWIAATCILVVGEGNNGEIHFSLKDYDTGRELLRYHDRNIDTWRSSGSDSDAFVRPKWGIYRSKETSANWPLGDETIDITNITIRKYK